MNAIWTEKYRPRSFEEFQGQPEIVQRVKAMIEQKNLPHMIFCGPAGVGKTTLALVIARQLFGENWRENFLELNASDTRGIDTIRITVKEFARTKSIGTDLQKIILLDEADALTRDAQQALRRTMETYSRTARFVLSANAFSKLIDPIKSRCAVFKFKPLEQEQVESIINRIAKSENIKVKPDARSLLFEVSRGDLRRVENMLQTAAAITKEVTLDHIKQVASKAEPKDIKDILTLAAVKKDFIEARKKLLYTMASEGLSGLDVIPEFQRQIWSLDGISDQKKLSMIQLCARTEFRIVEGSDEFLQLEALLAGFAKDDSH